MKSVRQRLSKGFTLVELMVTIAIAAIILTIGVPSFRSLIDNQRITTVTNDLFSAIKLARSEALSRGEQVEITPLDGEDWTNGWAVYIDNDGTDGLSMTSDEILFSSDSVPDGIAISENFSGTDVVFRGTGRLRTGAGTFTLSQHGEQRRSVVLNLIGRPKTKNLDD